MLRLFKVLFLAGLTVFGLYWTTQLVLDYGARLSVDGTALFTETWQQVAVLLPIYLIALIWFCWRWRNSALRAKRRRLKDQAALDNNVPPTARVQCLREQMKQWRLRIKVEGQRPAFLLFDWSAQATHPQVETAASAQSPEKTSSRSPDLRIDRVGGYTVLSVNSRLLSQPEPDEFLLWQCLLDELKTARGGYDLVGGTLLINAAQLWSLSEDQELQVLNLRARLEELARVIGKGLPIQAIVTHCASLTGFSPSILGLPVEQRDLVINLPLAANQPNLMRLADHMRSRTECLDDSLLDRLQMEPSTLTRTQLYGFSSLWRQFSAQAQVFFQAVFHAQARLQSVRFSADALTEDKAALSTSLLLLRTLQQCKRHGRWHTAFKTLRGWLQSHRRFWLMLLGIAVSVLLVNNYRHHSRVLDYLGQQQKVLQSVLPGTDSAALERFNALTKMVEVTRDNWLQPSLGLYQYRRLQTHIQWLYTQAFNEFLTPAINAGMAAVLSDPQANVHENLRVYLMLGGHGPREAQVTERELNPLLGQNPQRLLGRTGSDSPQGPLQGLLRRPLSDAPVLQINDALVSKARESINREGVSQRLYRQLSAQIQAQVANKELSVASESGAEGLLLMRSRSGQPLTQGVPWLFTVKGYAQFSKQLGAFVNHALGEEGWVMGLDRQHDLVRVREDILSLYFNDYIQHWEQFVADLQFANLDKPEQLPKQFDRLSQNQSALVRLLQLISRETRLSRPPENKGAIARLGEHASGLAQRWGFQAMALDRNTSGQDLVTQQFASLHKMTEAVEGAQIPMDQLREALAFCGSYLVARQAAAASGLPAPEVNALENLRSLVDTLPTILKPLFIELIETGDDWLGDRQSERLVQEWKKNLEPYCRVVEQHYPFDRNAKADLPLKDFNQLFSSQGRLQMFVQTQLTAGSEHSFHSFGRQPLDDGVEASAFTQFKRAELIGNVFFPAGAAQARIDFELTPITMDEEIASFSLSLDDRQLSYAHGPVAPSMFTWPAQALGSSLKAVVTLFDGRTLRLSEQGGWAWFRLLGRGTLTQGPSRDTQWLTLSFEGYEVVLQIRYDSVEHGVDAQLLREFRCPTL